MKFVLTDLIKEQAVQCLVMFCAGILLMAFYQICSFLSKQVTIYRWIRAVLEIFFWFTAAVAVSQFLYYCAYGSISIHATAAFVAGVLLWKKCFCGIILPTHCEGKRTRGLGNNNDKKKKEQSV